MKKFFVIFLFSLPLLGAPEPVSIDTKTHKVINPIVNFGSGNTLDGTGATIIGFPGSSYSFIDSLTQTTGTVNLVNDSATPGNSKYYGTDSGGTRGFFDLTGGGGTPGGSNTQFQYNNSGAFGGISSLTYDGTIPITATISNLGDTTTPPPALLLKNATAATAPTPTQSSPSIHWYAETWDGAESVPVEWTMYGYAAGAGTADGDWVLRNRLNGGDWNIALDFDANNPVTGPGLTIYGTLGTTNIFDASSYLSLFSPVISKDLSSGGMQLSAILGVNFALGIQTTDTNQLSLVDIIPHGTVANTPAVMTFFGTDYLADSTNYEAMQFTSKGSSDTYHQIQSIKGGTGTVRPIDITANASSQLVIGTDGGVSVGTGTAAGSTNLKVAGTIAASNFTPDSLLGLSGNGFVKRTGTNTYTNDTSTYITGNQTITLSGDVTGSGATAITTTQRRAVTFVVDGGGTVLTTGTKNPIKVNYGGTLQAWTIMCKPSGSVTVDIFRAADGASLPTVSIVGGGGTKPSVSSGVENSSTSFTSWTSTTLTAKDNLAISLSGVSTATYCALTLYYQ